MNIRTMRASGARLRGQLQSATQRALAAEERVATLEANEHDRQAAQ